MPPHWHATRTPHTSNALPESTLKEGSKPLGYVAHTMFLRSVITHRVHHLSPKLESRAEEVIGEDAEPYHENPPQAPPVPPSTLQLRPNVPPVFLGPSLPVAALPIPLSYQSIPPEGPACLRCVAHSAAVGRELKGMSYRLRFSPQRWESMARAADQSVLKSRWSHASEMRCACSVCFSSCHVSEVCVLLLSTSNMSSKSATL